MKKNVLLETIIEILKTEDPIHIIIANNYDEYNYEAKKIYEAINSSDDINQILDKVHIVFVEAFDGDIAGPKKNYLKIAETIFYKLRNNNA